MNVENIAKKEEEKRKKNRDNSAFYLAWDILYMP